MNKYIEKKTLTRKEYWIGVAVAYGIVTVLYALPVLGSGQLGRSIVAVLFFAAIIYLQVKRLRDAGKSLWLLLIHLLPGVGTIAVTIAIGCFKSDN